MKKILTSVIVLLLAAAAVPQEASAQKWLKKLGKIAEEVLTTPTSTADGKSTSGRSAKASATGVGNATLTNNVPGLDITFRKVERPTANSVKINMILMNTTDKNMSLQNLSKTGGIYTSEGDQLSRGVMIVGNKELTIGSEWGYDAELPSNVPVKAAIIINDCPSSEFTFSMIKLLPRPKGLDTCPIEIRNLAVPEMAAQIFKGVWSKTQKSDGMLVETVIDLNLYAKSIENNAGDFCYGNIVSMSDTGRIFYSISVNNVVSMDGNTAIVNCEEDRSGTAFRATLTYDPQTGNMCYKDEDSSFCLPKSKN